MLKSRGLLRVDEYGFYVCRFKYLRSGLNTERMTNPIYEVVSYRYFRFQLNGQCYSIQTTKPPHKALEKLSRTNLENLPEGFQIVTGTY